MSCVARSMMLSAGAIAVLFAAPAAAEWRPSKPIEFVATAGPGGGTDNLARAVQNNDQNQCRIMQAIPYSSPGI